MITSKPSLRSGFDCIIHPAPSSAGRTTPSQPGHYPLNISQIFLLYKTWGCYNWFDSAKSLGVCHWCAKIPQCGYVEHELKDIASYVQKHCSSSSLVMTSRWFTTSRIGAPTSVRLVYYSTLSGWYEALFPLFQVCTMPGVSSVQVALAEVLEVRGAPLREVEIWAMLVQAAEALQDHLLTGKIQDFYGLYIGFPSYRWDGCETILPLLWSVFMYILFFSLSLISKFLNTRHLVNPNYVNVICSFFSGVSEWWWSAVRYHASHTAVVP